MVHQSRGARNSAIWADAKTFGTSAMPPPRTAAAVVESTYAYPVLHFVRKKLLVERVEERDKRGWLKNINSERARRSSC